MFFSKITSTKSPMDIVGYLIVGECVLDDLRFVQVLGRQYENVRVRKVAFSKRIHCSWEQVEQRE